MPWNPDIYNQFKEKRREPFFDLISHIQSKPDMKVLDLGCGTGELTKIVADRFEAAHALGIDSSAEMLAKAPHQPNLSFAQRTVAEQLKSGDTWNLIVANASLQWVNNHEVLFPGIISQLMPGGQLAVQMPCQKENRLNQILDDLVHEMPWQQALRGAIRSSPLLSLDEYTQLLYANGAKETIIYQKVYPIIAQSVDTLYDFISGSALIPYMEKLQDDVKPFFIAAFKERISSQFPSSPMVYPFKRLILMARF